MQILLMGKVERNFIHACLQMTFSKFYCWFIDHIFLLWNESEAQFLDFITILNSKHPTTKFDFEYLKFGIEFSDTKIYKNKEMNKSLKTIYRKTTDRINLLDPTLAHPKSLINRILFSQTHLLKRFCSETSELKKHLNELRESFNKENFLTG